MDFEYSFNGGCFYLSEGDIIVTEVKEGNCDFVFVTIKGEFSKKYSLMRLDTMEVLVNECAYENKKDVMRYVIEKYGVEEIVPYNYINISY